MLQDGKELLVVSRVADAHPRLQLDDYSDFMEVFGLSHDSNVRFWDVPENGWKMGKPSTTIAADAVSRIITPSYPAIQVVGVPWSRHQAQATMLSDKTAWSNPPGHTTGEGRSHGCHPNQTHPATLVAYLHLPSTICIASHSQNIVVLVDSTMHKT